MSWEIDFQNRYIHWKKIQKYDKNHGRKDKNKNETDLDICKHEKLHNIVEKDNPLWIIYFFRTFNVPKKVVRKKL